MFEINRYLTAYSTDLKNKKRLHLINSYIDSRSNIRLFEKIL